MQLYKQNSATTLSLSRWQILYTLLTTAFWKQRQVDICDFKVSLVYKMSFPRATKLLSATELMSKKKKVKKVGLLKFKFKQTYCSCRGPLLSSQHPHGDPKPSSLNSKAEDI